MYSLIYHFEVNGESYTCESNGSSSSEPNTDDKLVYYNSNNPSKCVSEYDISNNKFFGIIFIIVSIIVVIFSIFGNIINKKI